MYFESVGALIRRIAVFAVSFGALTLICSPVENFGPSSRRSHAPKVSRPPDGTFLVEGPGGTRVVNSNEEVAAALVEMTSADAPARAKYYSSVSADYRRRRFLLNVWIGGSLCLVYFCFLRRPPLLSELHDRQSETRKRPPRALASQTEPQPNPLDESFDISQADERPPKQP